MKQNLVPAFLSFFALRARFRRAEMIVQPWVFRHVNAYWVLLKAEWKVSHPVCQEKW
jgi:hypothetical protein